MYQSSFLKWAGGKMNALPHVFSHIPKSGKVFVEPFAGGCTVALNTNYEHYILNDKNEDLINLFKAVCADPSAFIADLQTLFVEKNNNKDAFIELRELFNSTKDTWKRSLLFVYLNRHCYNGLMRYNLSGGFNTSFGDYKKPLMPTAAITFFADKFKNAEFHCGSFLDLDIPDSDAVIYCDPPYIPHSKTASFVGYTGDGFKKEDHHALNDIASTWRDEGHKVFISNSDTKLTPVFYPGRIKTFSFGVRRSISQKGGTRGNASELLMQY